MTEATDSTDSDTLPLQEPRLWRDGQWTARVIKNEEDDGWAVEMTRHGDPEPALVGPGPWAATRRTRSRSTGPPSPRW